MGNDTLDEQKKLNSNLTLLIDKIDQLVTIMQTVESNTRKI